MSQHEEDPGELTQRVPCDRVSNDQPDAGGGPPKSGVAVTNEIAEFHGDVRKGQDPQEEKD